MEPTNDEVNTSLKEKIENGEYHLGDLIVPQTFEKLSIKNGKIKREDIKIEGRKIPLLEIRKTMFKDHEQFMKPAKSDEEYNKMTIEDIIRELKTLNQFPKQNVSQKADKLKLLTNLKEIERTRHLMFWHDGSTISNHSHLLIMVATVYDTAIHYTDKEYEDIHKENVNVQAIIEKPYLYILARCPSNDQQIMYCEERISDILQTKEKVTFKGISFSDKVRFFKGDMPASQFEAGHQKGGNYFCTGCSIKSEDVNNLKLNNSSYISLHDRIKKVTVTSLSRLNLQKGKLKLYDCLDKADVITELHERGITFRSDAPLADLRTKLTINMHGIQRLPSLLYDNPSQSLDELQLQAYEILCNEPLHDVSNHIKNLFTEVIHHLPQNLKKSYARTNYKLVQRKNQQKIHLITASHYC